MTYKGTAFLSHFQAGGRIRHCEEPEGRRGDPEERARPTIPWIATPLRVSRSRRGLQGSKQVADGLSRRERAGRTFTVAMPELKERIGAGPKPAVCRQAGFRRHHDPRVEARGVAIQRPQGFDVAWIATAPFGLLAMTA